MELGPSAIENPKVWLDSATTADQVDNHDDEGNHEEDVKKTTEGG